MWQEIAAVLASAGIDPAEALVIRHAYVCEHEDGAVGIHGDSSDDEIMAYTRVQSANTGTFPATPHKFWIVFLPEGGDRARLWSVVVNHGEIARDGVRRTFDLEQSNFLADLRFGQHCGRHARRAARYLPSAVGHGCA